MTYQDLLNCGQAEQKCPYCAGFDDEKSNPVYEKYGMKVFVDGGFMYIYFDSGYHQVFNIEFCPMCGKDLRE